MNTAANQVTAENRVNVSDPRFDMRMTENFDDGESGSTGWTWVIAILIAAVLIVSGYLDQEAATFESTSGTEVSQQYASTGAAARVAVADTGRSGRGADKGY